MPPMLMLMLIPLIFMVAIDDQSQMARRAQCAVSCEASQWHLARGLATSGCGIGKRTKLQMGYEEVAGLAPKDKRVIIRKIDKNT
jgi:hypothetical protein